MAKVTALIRKTMIDNRRRLGISEKKEIEFVKIGATITDYPTSHEFLKSYLKVEAKIITPAAVVLNICIGHALNKYIFKVVRIKGPKWKSCFYT